MGYANVQSCYAIGVFFPVFGAVVVAARFLVRHAKSVPYGLDDWFALAGLVFTTACGACFALGAARNTFGAHFYVVKGSPTGNQTAEQWVLLRQLQYTISIFRDPAIGFIKLSILYFFRRVFKSGNRAFVILNNIMIALVSFWLLAFTMAGIFQCGTNIRYDFALPGPASAELPYVCLNREAWNLSGAVTDVALDIVIISIPLPIIWRLKMSTRKKVAVSFVFMTGLLAVAASIIRMASFIGFFEGFPKGDILGMNRTDIVQSITIGWFWTMIEIGVAQIVCCMPSLWPVFDHPDKAIARLRSMISLSSLRSGSSASGRTERKGSVASESVRGFGQLPSHPTDASGSPHDQSSGKDEVCHASAAGARGNGEQRDHELMRDAGMALPPRAAIGMRRDVDVTADMV